MTTIRPQGQPPRFLGKLSEQDFEVATLIRDGKNDCISMLMHGAKIPLTKDMLELIVHVNNIGDLRLLKPGEQFYIPKLESYEARKDVWIEAFADVDDTDRIVVKADYAGMLVRDFAKGGPRIDQPQKGRTIQNGAIDKNRERQRLEESRLRIEQKATTLIFELSADHPNEDKVLSAIYGHSPEEREILFAAYGGKDKLLKDLEAKLSNKGWMQAKACLRDNNPDGRLQIHDQLMIGTERFGTAEDSVMYVLEHACVPGKQLRPYLDKMLADDYNSSVDFILNDLSTLGTRYLGGALKRKAEMFLEAPRDENGEVPQAYKDAFDISEFMQQRRVSGLIDAIDGVKEAPILSIFENKSPQEIKAIFQAFKHLYPDQEGGDLTLRIFSQDGWSSKEREQLEVLLKVSPDGNFDGALQPNRNQAGEIDANELARSKEAIKEYTSIAIDDALGGKFGLRWNQNEDLLLHVASKFICADGAEIAGKVSLAELAAYRKTDESKLREQMLKSFGNEKAELRGIMELALDGGDIDNDPRAIAYNIHKALDGSTWIFFSTHAAAMGLLSRLSAEKMAEVRDAYQSLFGVSLPEHIIEEFGSDVLVEGSNIPNRALAEAMKGTDYFADKGDNLAALYDKETGELTEAAKLMYTLAGSDKDAARDILLDITRTDPFGASAAKLTEDYRTLMGRELVDDANRLSPSLGALAGKATNQPDILDDPTQLAEVITGMARMQYDERTNGWSRFWGAEDEMYKAAILDCVKSVEEAMSYAEILRDDQGVAIGMHLPGEQTIESPAGSGVMVSPMEMFSKAIENVSRSDDATAAEIKKNAQTTATIVSIAVGIATLGAGAAVSSAVNASRAVGLAIKGTMAGIGMSGSRVLVEEGIKNDLQGKDFLTPQAIAEAGLGVFFVWAPGSSAITTKVKALLAAKGITDSAVVAKVVHAVTAGHGAGLFSTGAGIVHGASNAVKSGEELSWKLATDILKSYGIGFSLGAGFTALGQVAGKLKGAKAKTTGIEKFQPAQYALPEAARDAKEIVRLAKALDMNWMPPEVLHRMSVSSVNGAKELAAAYTPQGWLRGHDALMPFLMKEPVIAKTILNNLKAAQLKGHKGVQPQKALGQGETPAIKSNESMPQPDNSIKTPSKVIENPVGGTSNIGKTSAGIPENAKEIASLLESNAEFGHAFMRDLQRRGIAPDFIKVVDGKLRITDGNKLSEILTKHPELKTGLKDFQGRSPAQETGTKEPVGEKKGGENPVVDEPVVTQTAKSAAKKGEKPVSEKKVGEEPVGEKPVGEKKVGEKKIGNESAKKSWFSFGKTTDVPFSKTLGKIDKANSAFKLNEILKQRGQFARSYNAEELAQLNQAIETRFIAIAGKAIGKELPAVGDDLTNLLSKANRALSKMKGKGRIVDTDFLALLKTVQKAGKGKLISTNTYQLAKAVAAKTPMSFIESVAVGIHPNALPAAKIANRVFRGIVTFNKITIPVVLVAVPTGFIVLLRKENKMKRQLGVPTFGETVGTVKNLYQQELQDNGMLGFNPGQLTIQDEVRVGSDEYKSAQTAAGVADEEITIVD